MIEWIKEETKFNHNIIGFSILKGLSLKTQLKIEFLPPYIMMVKNAWKHSWKETLKQIVGFLLSNCFFKFGKKVFQKVIWIPMGWHPALFFANLFLYYGKTSGLLKRKNIYLIGSVLCNYFHLWSECTQWLWWVSTKFIPLNWKERDKILFIWRDHF